MTPKEEAAYLLGQAQLARRIMGECLKCLPSPEHTQESWRLERADIVIALKSLCSALGWDDAWDEETHLGDVINKFPR